MGAEPSQACTHALDLIRRIASRADWKHVGAPLLVRTAPPQGFVLAEACDQGFRSGDDEEVEALPRGQSGFGSSLRIPHQPQLSFWIIRVVDRLGRHAVSGQVAHRWAGALRRDLRGARVVALRVYATCAGDVLQGAQGQSASQQSDAGERLSPRSGCHCRDVSVLFLHWLRRSGGKHYYILRTRSVQRPYL